MKLYHFTSYQHMLEIIADGKLKRTPSNLLEPVNPRIENGVYVSDTDDYKPVVWLTSKATPDRLGVDTPELPPQFNKHRVRLEISPPPFLNICKWEPWADSHGISPKWKAALIKNMDYDTWYISEGEIPIAYVSRIIDLFEKTEIIGYKGGAQ